MRLRLNYTDTPDHTNQFYGAPFVSTGTNSNVRELSATPDADNFAERFQAYTPPPGSETSF
jgi:hypothetical protein